jgi:hypothetical protein
VEERGSVENAAYCRFVRVGGTFGSPNTLRASSVNSGVEPHSVTTVTSFECLLCAWHHVECLPQSLIWNCDCPHLTYEGTEAQKGKADSWEHTAETGSR